MHRFLHPAISRMRSVAPVFAGLAGVVFVIAFAARPAVLLAPAALDDALFIQLGRSLASGRWLGPYNEAILAKGMGFPAFLALANLLGLPYPLALALFYLACSGLAATVVGRVLGSRLAGTLLFVLLLLVPPLYAGELLRVNREVFYTSLTLGLVGAAIALCAGRGLPRAWSVVLAGALGGWWWLTREEGVWLAPSLLLLALASRCAGRGDAPKGSSPLARLRPFAPASAAALIAGCVVGLVGLANWACYGRFVVNEVKDRAFQSALSALQRAAPDHRPRVPVPKAARARIYAVSPTFASLRTPALDGPEGAVWLQASCGSDARICGDIGGGWFTWALRQAAALQGAHRSPAEAAVFYRRLAGEVRQACDAGRLRCIVWAAPLIPPMHGEQLGDVAASLGRTLAVITFTKPVNLDRPASDFAAPEAVEMHHFLNSPAVEGASTQLRFSGWFVGSGEQWFDLRPGPGMRLLQASRQSSPDLVAHFHDARLSRQRFEIDVDCPTRGRCPLELAPQGQAALPLDMAALAPGPHRLGSVQVYVDAVGGREPRYLRNRISDAWVGVAARLNPFYLALTAAGGAAFLILLVRDVRARRLSLAAVLCLALLGGVALRALLLALVDALSFPAANVAYALPAIPLTVVFAVVALHQAIQALTRKPGTGMAVRDPGDR